MTQQLLNIPAVILAGGAGARMGGVDKCLLPIGGQAILSRILSTLSSQTQNVCLNINGDSKRFHEFKVPIITDAYSPPIGPIGGLHSSYQSIKERNPNAQWMLTVTGDSPFIPEDLIAKLLQHTDENTDVVFCKSGNRDHFAIALWSLTLEPQLQTFIDKGNRSMGRFIQHVRSKVCEFSTSPYDPFFNINTHEQWQTAQDLLEKLNA